MKKFKMVASVFMVMVLTLSAFSFTASAANTIEPKAVVLLCPECVQMTARYISTECDVVGESTVYTCDYVTNVAHKHQIHHRYDVLKCSNCGRVEVDVDYRVYCKAMEYYI